MKEYLASVFPAPEKPGQINIDQSSAKRFISENGTGKLLSYWDLIKLELMPPEPPEEEEESDK